MTIKDKIDFIRRSLSTGYLNTVTGYPLTLTKTLAKPPQSITVLGNTGGVGDKTANLFDGEIEIGDINADTGARVTADSRTRSKNYIPVKPNTKYTIFSSDITSNSYMWVMGYTDDYIGITDGNANDHPASIAFTNVAVLRFTTTATTQYIKWREINSVDLSKKVMLVEGSYTAATMPPYEHYGYQIPILINPPILPSGYTELEYIESTGEQYIDTRIIATNNTGMSIKYCYTAEGSAAISGIFKGANPRQDVFFISSQNGSTSGRVFIAHKGVTSGLTTGDIALNTDYTVKINYKNDGKIYYNDDYIVNIGANDVYNATIPIFARLNASNQDIAASNSRIYYVEFTEGNTISHKFVPAKNSIGTIGMYDLVSNVFYENAGSGDFIAGAEIPNKTINLYSDAALGVNESLTVNPKTHEATKHDDTSVAGLQDWEQDWKIPKADSVTVAADTTVAPGDMEIVYWSSAKAANSVNN